MTTPQQRSAFTHRPELDGIRAFAVLAVIAFHSDLKPATGGWLGVDIFFVLSGYLITLILLREHGRTGSVSMRDFWGRRILRLYPALVITLLAGMVFFSTLGDEGTFVGYLRTAAAAGFYYENLLWAFSDNAHGGLGHTWSLAVEMQFYIVWPAVAALLLRRGAKLSAWIIAGIAVSFALFVWQSQPAPAGAIAFPDSYYLPWTRAFELLLGALVAVRIFARPAPAHTGPRRRWLGWLIGMAFGVLLLAAWTDSIFVRPEAVAWESPAAALLTAALILHLEQVRQAGVGRLLAWRPVAWIGLVSYGVYLYHYPVILVLKDQFDITEAKVTFVLALPITLALAGASWHFAEKPLLRLKSRFGGGPETLPSTAPKDAQPIE